MRFDVRRNVRRGQKRGPTPLPNPRRGQRRVARAREGLHPRGRRLGTAPEDGKEGRSCFSELLLELLRILHRLACEYEVGMRTWRWSLAGEISWRRSLAGEADDILAMEPCWRA